MDNDKIIQTLKSIIDNKRFEHSMGVSITAGILAEHYGQDVAKARLAGLVHDCAKCLSLDKMHKLVNDYCVKIDDSFMCSCALLHGPLGAEVAKRMLEIDDRTVLDAVSIHTTGKKRMTEFDKIICLADYIEPGRKFPGVEKIRELAYVDLDIALLKAFDSSIRSILDKGNILHPQTVEARNDLINIIRTNNKYKILQEEKL